MILHVVHVWRLYVLICPLPEVSPTPASRIQAPTPQHCDIASHLDRHVDGLHAPVFSALASTGLGTRRFTLSRCLEGLAGSGTCPTIQQILRLWQGRLGGKTATDAAKYGWYRLSLVFLEAGLSHLAGRTCAGSFGVACPPSCLGRVGRETIYGASHGMSHLAPSCISREITVLIPTLFLDTEGWMMSVGKEMQIYQTCSLTEGLEGETFLGRSFSFFPSFSPIAFLLTSSLILESSCLCSDFLASTANRAGPGRRNCPCRNL